MNMLTDEQFTQNTVETTTEKEIMEEKAQAKAATVTQYAGYHPREIEQDCEKIDHLANLMVNFINELLPEYEEGLNGDRTYFLQSLIWNSEYRLGKKKEAFKKVAFGAIRATKEDRGDEISSQKKQDAVNRCHDVEYQIDNMEKHLLPALEATWDLISDEPRSTGKPAPVNMTDQDDCAIAELVRRAGIVVK